MTRHSAYSADLSRLLEGICPVPAVLDTRIHGIQLDSRRVKKGDLFIALSGDNYSAEAHLQEAIERGANAVLVEGNLLNGSVHESGEAVELYLPNLRKVVGLLADRFFHFPSRELTVVGVTGTNGKTSVTHYIAQMYQLNGLRAGVIGTLGYGEWSSERALNTLQHTTPDVIEVHRILAEMRDLGLTLVAMEVSSHGIEQGRVDQVHFAGAVFTNLTRDHLDYHGTMEAYGAVKKRLFQWPSLKFAVINLDDEYGAEIQDALDEEVACWTYSMKQSRSGLENPDRHLEAELDGQSVSIRADVETPAGEMTLVSSLVGQFNLSNLLASMGVCLALGGTKESLTASESVRAVKGRMEVLRIEGFPLVVVDYAHTPDALENLIEAARPYCQGKMHLMFGCGGDRDRGKRALMAEAAERLADHIVVTDDNPRTESPEQIINDILEGFSEQDEIEVIHQRSKAIAQIISVAKAGDVVILAGKGHENYQEINDVRYEFDDLQVARQSIDDQLGKRAEDLSCD